MRKNIKKKKTLGQGATEYVIILVLVAIGSIAVITVFGDNLRDIFSVSTDRLQGDDTTTLQKKKASADDKEATLGDF